VQFWFELCYITGTQTEQLESIQKRAIRIIVHFIRELSY